MHSCMPPVCHPLPLSSPPGLKLHEIVIVISIQFSLCIAVAVYFLYAWITAISSFCCVSLSIYAFETAIYMLRDFEVIYWIFVQLVGTRIKKLRSWYPAICVIDGIMATVWILFSQWFNKILKNSYAHLVASKGAEPLSISSYRTTRKKEYV